MFDKNSVISQNNIQSFLNAKFMLTQDTAWQPWLKFCTQPTLQAVQDAKLLGLWHGDTVTDEMFAKALPSLLPVKAVPGTEPEDETVPHPVSQSEALPDDPSWESTACPKGLVHA